MARWFVNVSVLALMSLAGCTSPAPSTSPLTKEQRAKALQRAAAYCKKKGLVMRSETPPTRSAQAASEVQFRCVKAG